jgi:hypothetical protein
MLSRDEALPVLALAVVLRRALKRWHPLLMTEPPRPSYGRRLRR